MIYEGFVANVALRDGTHREYIVNGDFPPIMPKDSFFHFGELDNLLSINVSQVLAITYKMIEHRSK